MQQTPDGAFLDTDAGATGPGPLEPRPPRATDRLFFALYPDAEAAARIAALASALRLEHGLHGKPLAAARLHVTLHYLGDHAGLPADLVEAARAAASGVAAPAFAVGFDHAVSFSRPRNRPFVLLAGDGGAELRRFQWALGAALAEAGLPHTPATRYTPHVTLLYDDRHVAARPVEPIGWTVGGFALMHSLLGQSRHEVLTRWVLG